MSQNLPIILFNGEDRVLQFTLLDSAGAPLDLTAWEIEFYLGDRSTTPLLTKAVTITDAPAGECETAPITPAELTGLTSGVKRYTLRRVDTGNNTVLQLGNVPVEVTF